MTPFRHEYKYVLSAAELAIVQTRAEGVMSLDSHAKGRGAYTIRSVYFDTADGQCLRENLDGTDPRHKWRIRTYDGNPHRIALERKAKLRGRCRKESCLLTREQCEALLLGSHPSLNNAHELLQRFAVEIVTRGLRPVVVVEYDRVPFVYPVGNVRVTLDCNLRASSVVRNFLCPSLPMRPVMPVGQHLLEVKWDEFLPEHIRETIAMPTLQWTNFSKFATCCQRVSRR